LFIENPSLPRRFAIKTVYRAGNAVESIRLVADCAAIVGAFANSGRNAIGLPWQKSPQP
jgi:hypothetical protein